MRQKIKFNLLVSYFAKKKKNIKYNENPIYRARYRWKKIIEFI